MILQRVGIPIYLQVKNYILEKIKAGEYASGMKLPTERELSAEMGISRNTVSAAYKELLLEGVLEARQGRGTFVKRRCEGLSGPDEEVSGSKRERLVKIIDEAMAKVVELGFSVEQFAAIATIRAQEKAAAVRELRVAVVESVPEFIRRFISQLGQVANVRFEPVTVAELTEEKVPVTFLEACDFVITTLDYQASLAAMVKVPGKIVAVAAVPNLEAVIKLARLPVQSKVGVLAATPEFVVKLKCLTKKMAVNNLEFDVLNTDDTEEIRRFIAGHRTLVVSEERKDLAGRLAVEGQEIITFYFEIDRGSLNQVMLRLVSQAV
jgi:DNA-binding GntR family transcriptional regulator